MAKFPFRAINPATLDAPFAQFAPAALISFRHPGGYPFLSDRDSEGVLKSYGDSEGGYAFFTGTFPKKYHPPYKKFRTVPYFSM